MIEVNEQIDNEIFSGVNYPKGRLAKFKRTNYQPLLKITENGVKEQRTASLSIPLQYTAKRHRNGQDEMVQIRFFDLKSESNFQGNKVVVYEPNAVHMEGEFLILDMNKPRDKELFKVLKNHPLEKDNAASYGKIPMFEYYDPQADAKKANADKVRKAQAIALVYDDQKVNRGLAVKIHGFLKDQHPEWTDSKYLATIEDYDSIRANLAEYAEKHPDEFNKLIADHNVGLRAEIKEAEELGVILNFDRQWLWNHTVKARNNKVITNVPAGEDDMTELVSFFVTNKKDGAKALEGLRDEVKAAKEARANS